MHQWFYQQRGNVFAVGRFEFQEVRLFSASAILLFNLWWVLPAILSDATKVSKRDINWTLTRCNKSYTLALCRFNAIHSSIFELATLRRFDTLNDNIMIFDANAIELVYYLIWLNGNPIAHDEKVSNNPQLFVTSNSLRTPTTLFKYSTQIFLVSLRFYFFFFLSFFLYISSRLSLIHSLALCFVDVLVWIHCENSRAQSLPLLMLTHRLCAFVCVFLSSFFFFASSLGSIEHRNPICHRNAATQQTHFLHVFFSFGLQRFSFFIFIFHSRFFSFSALATFITRKVEQKFRSDKENCEYVIIIIQSSVTVRLWTSPLDFTAKPVCANWFFFSLISWRWNEFIL